MPEELSQAIDALRPLLADADQLVRAVASGRRKGVPAPADVKAEIRPVELKSGRQLQVVTTDGLRPTTRNLTGTAAATEVERLLAEPFGTWYVETVERVVQLRVTKRGEAQVHETRTSRREIAPAGHDRVKQRLLDPGDPLFAALGADADKRRQVDAFLRALAPVARRALDPAAEAGRRARAVDLGCGNAYLTFAAHRWLAAQAPLQTIGVDVRPDMVERNTRLAAELGMAPLGDGSDREGSDVEGLGAEGLGAEGLGAEGLAFETGTIEASGLGRGRPVDLVLALHACDTATDDALALAVRWRAPVILAAPCCHHDLQRQLTQGGAEPPHPYGTLTRHAILRERFADVLTDALRADILRLLGYRVDVVEFVDSRHTPRNVLLRAVRTGARPTPRRVAEYRDLVAAWNVTPALALRLEHELAEVITP